MLGSMLAVCAIGPASRIGAPFRCLGSVGVGGSRTGGEFVARSEGLRARARPRALRPAAAPVCGRQVWESSYVGLRTNLRPIGLLAIGLPLATTAAVGFVAYKTVPAMTIAAGLTLGAIVAPPDAVSAAAIGRRLAAAPDHDVAGRGELAQ